MNNLNVFLTYILTLSIAALIPGPGMLGLMFKTLFINPQKALSMLLGLITGDLIYLYIAILGINYISHFADSQFSLLLILMACLYLFYLSYMLWNTDRLHLTSPKQTSELNLANSPSFYTSYSHGLVLTLANPKTITFYLAVVPAIFGENLNLDQSFLWVITLSTMMTLFIVGSIYILAAQQLKKILENAHYQNLLMKFMAIIMFLIAMSILISRVFSPSN